MRRTSFAAAVAATAACTVLTGLLAGPAAAAPGDPHSEFGFMSELAHRNVAVGASGDVFVDARSEPGYLPISYLEHGYVSNWVRWDRTEAEPATWSGLAAGANGYAVNVRFSSDDEPATYRTHDGDAWGDTTDFLDIPLRDAEMDANSAGDIALLVRERDSDQSSLVVIPRVGQRHSLGLDAVPASVSADVTLNEQGKATVVWAAPSRGASTIRRIIVRERSYTPSTPQRLGTVNDPRPNVSVESDGRGRETIIAGNHLWRQPHTSRPPEHLMRTSVRALVTTGEQTTRVVWPVLTDTGYAVRSMLFDDLGQHPQTTLWSHQRPRAACRADAGLDTLALGLGMAPSGRSYVAVGIRREIGTDDECANIASFLAVDRAGRVLNASPLGYFTNGEEFQVAASGAGPIAVEFKNWDDHADPISDDQPDGRYSLQFFRR